MWKQLLGRRGPATSAEVQPAAGAAEAAEPEQAAVDEQVTMLVEMGFDKTQVDHALAASGGDASEAALMLLSLPVGASVADEGNAATSSAVATAAGPSGVAGDGGDAGADDVTGALAELAAEEDADAAFLEALRLSSEEASKSHAVHQHAEEDEIERALRLSAEMMPQADNAGDPSAEDDEIEKALRLSEATFQREVERREARAASAASTKSPVANGGSSSSSCDPPPGESSSSSSAAAGRSASRPGSSAEVLKRPSSRRMDPPLSAEDDGTLGGDESTPGPSRPGTSIAARPGSADSVGLDDLADWAPRSTALAAAREAAAWLEGGGGHYRPPSGAGARGLGHGGGAGVGLFGNGGSPSSANGGPSARSRSEASSLGALPPLSKGCLIGMTPNGALIASGQRPLAHSRPGRHGCEETSTRSRNHARGAMTSSSSTPLLAAASMALR
eukprot:TRINITY_DN22079_c0_g2_i1.p1 TRINITY_DN22079_c0_g2~~TRINITY_DN22079_c0_g2_i1.p1  ORF type:complete len:447 (+),score=116.39 TRINITY_DN22079_c0_g2_i1:178-1518(+)